MGHHDEGEVPVQVADILADKDNSAIMIWSQNKQLDIMIQHPQAAISRFYVAQASLFYMWWMLNRSHSQCYGRWDSNHNYKAHTYSSRLGEPLYMGMHHVVKTNHRIRWAIWKIITLAVDTAAHLQRKINPYITNWFPHKLPPFQGRLMYGILE